MIRLEIGALAAWTPSQPREIRPYSAERYPAAFRQASTVVLTAAAERTFWEKVTILHHEANRPEHLPMPSRYSRHYYDLYCIAHSESKAAAYEDLDLLGRLVEGTRLTAQENARLRASRDQFAAFWRILDRHLKQGKLETDLLPYLRSLAAQVGGCDSFLRAALALTVFQERGLISLSRQEDRVTLCLNPIQGKVDLYASPCLRRLRGGAEVKRGDSQ